MTDEIDLTVLTMVFDGLPEADDRLRSILAKYTVLTRSTPGIRNIDLMHSITRPGRYTIVEKWDSPSAQRNHFDSPHMVDMAESCRGLLAAAPAVDLHEGMSTHDLL